METATQYPNWFKVTAEAPFQRHLLMLAGKPNLRFLQIGAFTGDASVWLLDNVLTGPGSLLVDVDTWKGSDELAHEAFDWADVERVYRERTAWACGQARLDRFKMTSQTYFASPRDSFDFVYVDGAHDTDPALADADGAFGVLKPGGLLAFDDYNWGTVAAAVNEFRRAHGDDLETLELGSQAWFRRVA